MQGVDTTPIYPRPEFSRIDEAMGHLARVAEFVAPDEFADVGLIVRALLRKGASVAEAMWAVHLVIREGGMNVRDMRKNRPGNVVFSESPPAGLEIDQLGPLHICTRENDTWAWMAVSFEHEYLQRSLAEVREDYGPGGYYDRIERPETPPPKHQKVEGLPELIDRIVETVRNSSKRVLDEAEVEPINELDAKINAHCQLIGLARPEVETKSMQPFGFCRIPSNYSVGNPHAEPSQRKAGLLLFDSPAWLQAMRGLKEAATLIGNAGTKLNSVAAAAGGENADVGTAKLPAASSEVPLGPLPDGPAPPNMLRFGGNTVVLERIPWRLIDYMWNRDSASTDDVIQHVWSDPANMVADRALVTAQGKANKALESSGVGWRLGTKQGYVVKKSLKSR